MCLVVVSSRGVRGQQLGCKGAASPSGCCVCRLLPALQVCPRDGDLQQSAGAPAVWGPRDSTQLVSWVRLDHCTLRVRDLSAYSGC